MFMTANVCIITPQRVSPVHIWAVYRYHPGKQGGKACLYHRAIENLRIVSHTGGSAALQRGLFAKLGLPATVSASRSAGGELRTLPERASAIRAKGFRKAYYCITHQ